MSAIGQMARCFVLAAICCGVAFADGHPRHYLSDFERRGGRTPDAQLAPEFESTKTALPHVKLFVSRLPNPDSNVLQSLESFEGQQPGTQIKPETKLAKLAAPRPTPLLSNPTNHKEFGSPIGEPFDLPAMTAWPGEVSAKWADLQSRIRSDEGTLAACRSDAAGCSQAVDRFLSIVVLGREREGRARLGWINRAVNLRIKPMSDWAQYGYVDFWASPLQTLSSRAGDCEDYAIVKYAALRELGIAPRDLRIVVVRDNVRQMQHAVLAVYNKNNWLILDNRTMTILTAEQARHYYPLFVMDHRGVRVFSTVAAR